MIWYVTSRDGPVAVVLADSPHEAVMAQRLPGESEHRAVEASGGMEVDPQPWHLWFMRLDLGGRVQEYVAGYWVYSERAWKRSGRSA